MIQEATASEQLLQKLHRTKWLQKCPDKDLQLFYHRKSSLSTVDGSILFEQTGDCSIELTKYDPKTFTFWTSRHCCKKALARSYVYWTNMDTQLEDFHHNCSKWQQQKPRKNRHSFLGLSPFHHGDIFILIFRDLSMKNVFCYYMNAYSKWLFPINCITSGKNILKLHFQLIRSPRDLWWNFQISASRKVSKTCVHHHSIHN